MMKGLKSLTLSLFGCLYLSLSGQNNYANPENIDDWHGKTVMYFSPHPDDDLFASGTLAKLANNGNTVYIVMFTNGNKGTHDLEMTSERLAKIRREEDIAANKILGIPAENIFFLGYDDGMLEYVPPKEIVEKVCWYIRKYRPDAVFTMDPGSKYMVWHKTDHRAVAILSVDGARAAAYHLYFPHHLIDQGLNSHTISDWFFYESDGDIIDGNYKVDITDVAELKWQAACQHTSQLGKGNIKYTGEKMATEDKEQLREMIVKDADGKVYEYFKRTRESLSY